VRRFRTSFRRRRRLAPGRAPGGRRKQWITRFFPGIAAQTQGTNEFIDLFELVAPEDYGDAGSVVNREQNYGTVVRCVGKVEVDLLVEAPGSNGLLWSAALFVRSRRSVFSEFGADPTQFFIHPEASTGSPEQNLQSMRPMAWMPNRSFSGTFRLNDAAGACSDFFSHINRPAQSEPWYFDVKQRRKMVTDESLYMLVSGVYICPINDEAPAIHTVLARTLIHAD